MGELKANATITVSGRYDARYPAQQFDYIYDGVQLSNGDTFTVTGKERVLIINADISNSGAGKDGILITDSKDVVILKSRIYDMPKGNIGVHLYATASNRTENVTIQDCDIFNIGSDGIKVETANDQDQGKEAYKYSFPIRGVKIVGNRIHEVGMLRSGSPKHGIYGKGENILFENNTILNCYWGSGISARNTAVIRGNVVGNTTGGCIDFWAQTRNGNTDTAIIENNLCYQNATVPAANGTDYAYVFGFSSAPDGDNPDFIIKNYIVRNNTFVATAIANKDYNVVSVRKVYPFQTMVMEGNLYVDPRAKPLYINNKELTSYSGNVEVNTLDVFVNPAIGDYRLKTKGTAGVPGLR